MGIKQEEIKICMLLQGSYTGITPLFRKSKEDTENCRLISLTTAPEEILLETISKHIKDKKVTGHSQHVFIKGKLCLTNLTVFCDEMTGLLNEGRAVDVVYLDFSKAFDTASYGILTDKTKCKLEK